MSNNQKITALGLVFDATQVAPSAPMEAIPPGWYSVAITDGEVKPTEGGNGRRLALEWTVTEGQFKGRKVFDGFNIGHSNPQAQEIAARDLSAICHATGVFQVQDVSQLFQKPHQIKVDVEPSRTVDANGDATDLPPGSPNTKTYEAKNRFKGAKTGSAPATVATGAPGAAAPAWAAKPAGAAPAPAATKPGKPGRKPGAKPAAAAPADTREFFVSIEAPEFADALPVSKLLEYFGKGMPVNTPICLSGESAYKTAAEYGISVNAAPAAAVPPPAPAPVAPPAPAPVAPPPAAAPAAGSLPPWQRVAA